MTPEPEENKHHEPKSDPTVSPRAGRRSSPPRPRAAAKNPRNSGQTRRVKPPSGGAPPAPSPAVASAPVAGGASSQSPAQPAQASHAGGHKRRRGRRGGRGRGRGPASAQISGALQSPGSNPPAPSVSAQVEVSQPPAPASGQPTASQQPGREGKRRRGRRGGRGRNKHRADAPGASAGSSTTSQAADKNRILINRVDVEECRIALLRGQSLQELFIETNRAKLRGNIYKARVTNIEPSIQAAFVDFGGERNGFLHVSDVMPSYARDKDGAARRKIEDMLRPGQNVLVQVTREGLGHKGPSMTTFLSIPGRYLVLMPGMNKSGVSKKIIDESVRHELKNILRKLEPPAGMGYIIRTAGSGRSEDELRQDLDHLLRLWQGLDAKVKNIEAPALLYQESSLVVRTLRDWFLPEIDEVLIDSREAYDEAVEFFKMTMPQFADRVRLYQATVPMFSSFRVEEQIEQIHQHKTPLAHGAYLVINQTEAMATIDVNTGKFTSIKDAEETAYKTNLAAAVEAPRQIRLRDLAGLILIDFIDMRDPRHIQEVERVLHREMEHDKARHRLLHMSKFCIVEMTRQRMRHSKESLYYVPCPACLGRGSIKSADGVAMGLLRSLRQAVARGDYPGVEAVAHPDVATFIQNRKRAELARLEEAHGKLIAIYADPSLKVHETRVRPAHLSLPVSPAAEIPAPHLTDDESDV